MRSIHTSLIQQLHEYTKKYQYQRAVIGLSGGLDSAVALCLAVRSFGPQNVTALIMPEIGLTPNDDIEQARLLADHLGCPSHYQPINNFLVDFHFVPWEKNEEANEQLKAQVRTLLLEHFAQSQNALFIGTANKSDLTLGYGSKGGEFSGELWLLGDLYKSEIIELAHHLQLPDELINKPASRWLKPNQSDESDLGSPWSKIDDIIRQLNDGVDQDTMIEKGMDSLTVHKVARMMQQNGRKRNSAPILHAHQVSDSISRARALEQESA